MTFRVACSLTALVGLILFGLLLVVPGVYTATYGVPADTGGMFMGRRASPLFLGLVLMLWALRDHTDAAVQRAICRAMVVLFAGVAVTGIWAFADGTAAAPILLAATGELVIAVAFWWVMPRTD
jgi:hypothetical protein